MTRAAGKTVTKEKTNRRTDETLGELHQKIWAVIDESGCRLIDVSYDEAQAWVNDLPGTIITAIAARRTS